MKSINKLFLLIMALSAGHQSFAQSSIYFYCPTGAIPAASIGVSVDDKEIGRIAQGQFFKFSSPAGRREFIATYAEKTDNLTILLENGKVYFVQCGSTGTSTNLKATNFNEALSVLPINLSDSIEREVTETIGISLIAKIKLNSRSIQNVCPVTTSDSVMVWWEERYPLLTGESSFTTFETIHGKPRAVWVTKGGSMREQPAATASGYVIWGVCDDQSAYYSKVRGVNTNINLHWSGNTDEKSKTTIKGISVGSWTNGNTLFIVTTEKGEKAFSITTVTNGKIVARRDYPMVFSIIDRTNENIQFIASEFDFDYNAELAQTKIYHRGNQLIFTKDDNGLRVDGYAGSKSFISVVNTITGEIKNQTFFVGNVMNGGVATTIAGPYSIWLVKEKMIKIRDLESGSDLTEISLIDDLPQQSVMLRRHDKMKHEILLRGKLRSPRINFVTGEVNHEGNLILRAGQYTASASTIYGGGSIQETRYIFLELKGSNPTYQTSPPTILQKLDKFEMLIHEMGVDVDQVHYGFGLNRLYTIHKRKGENMLRVYRIGQ